MTTALPTSAVAARSRAAPRLSAPASARQLSRPRATPTPTPSPSSCPCGGSCPRCTEASRSSLLGNSSGESLPGEMRNHFEQRLQQPLGDVRIHRDQPTARRLGANAVTIGRDVAFAPGKFQPYKPEGDRLIAHELAHTIQQRHISVPTQRSLPVSQPDSPEEQAAQASAEGDASTLTVSSPQAARDIIREDPWAAEARARDFRRMTISVVRDPIIEALRRRDSVDFLNRLRSATDDAEDRRLLATDPVLREALEREFAGSPRSLWISRRILQFGRTLPDYVRSFETAVREHNTADVIRYLRAFDDLRNESSTPGVRDWLSAEYRGSSDRTNVLNELAVSESMRMERTTAYRDEIHYETNETTGARELRLFTATEHYDVARTGAQTRIIMRMKLVQGTDRTQAYYPESALANRWLNGIQSVWNNKFRLTNGTSTLDLVFVPVFTSTNPHRTIAVHHGTGDAAADRADASNWYESDGSNTAAHEFGHFLGNQDEYNLPGSLAEVPAASFPGLDADELSRSSWEGIYGVARPVDTENYDTPTIMGASHSNTAVELRHVSYIVSWFNSAMLSPGEASYRAVFR